MLAWTGAWALALTVDQGVITGLFPGLGLSLSYDIVVKQHGGDLTVESQPGQFTVFKASFPRNLPANFGGDA